MNFKKWRWLSAVIGFLSLLWFVLRTGTKPSRAHYPCQRAARLNVNLCTTPLFLVVFASVRQFKANAEKHFDKIVAAVLALTLVLNIAGFSEAPNATFSTASMSTTSTVFVVRNANYTRNEGNLYPAVTRLFEMMKWNGIDFYNLIQPNDVVVVKVNCQWGQRGGTNTDLVKAVIQKIVEHPSGWNGEVVIADNGQGRGSLDWGESNSYTHSQSMADVANYFIDLGWPVSTFEWEDINYVVSEYEEGDYNDGYVTVEPYYRGYLCSYPKFETAYGTYISLHKGVWDGVSYDKSKLKILNVPVLKTHSGYAVTSVVKHYMGVVSQPVSDAHNSISDGVLGDILDLAYPTLNIIDAIYVNPIPWSGPYTSYNDAVLADTVIAGTDPVATDYIGSKEILVPVANAEGYDSSSMNPDSSYTYRRYLMNSLNKLIVAGRPGTMNSDQIDVISTSTQRGNPLIVVAKAFGSRIGDHNWNPLADMVQDGVIDILDVVFIARNFVGNIPRDYAYFSIDSNNPVAPSVPFKVDGSSVSSIDGAEYLDGPWNVYTVTAGTHSIEWPASWTNPTNQITYQFQRWGDGVTDNPRTMIFDAGVTYTLEAILVPATGG